MPERHSKEQRSHNMACIRSRGNATTEMRVVRLFRERGITGWRRHLDLPGRPDFTFQAERVILFLDGCFWHGCPRCRWIPKNNSQYWAEKFANNRRKDRQVTRVLRAAGYRVLRFWEHQLAEAPVKCIAAVKKAISKK